MRTGSAPREVHIGKVVRDAAVFNLRNPRGGTVSDSALLDAVDRLFALLEERRIDYLLVGGIALLQYVEGRNAEDIGLLAPVPARTDRQRTDRSPGSCHRGARRLQVSLNAKAAAYVYRGAHPLNQAPSEAACSGNGS